MATHRRYMLINDNSDELKYSGNWFIDTYDQPGPLQFIGWATKGTAHGTNTTASFTFSFEGKLEIAPSIAFVLLIVLLGRAPTVRGQSNVIPATTNSVLRCTVDGVEVGSDVVLANNIRSWKLCNGPDLIDGHHDVVVNIIAGADTVFWVDEIYYETMDQPDLRKRYSRYPADTGEFRYKGVSWASPFNDDFGYSRESYENGAIVTIPFYGASMEVTAYLTSQMPRSAGRASYSLDGGPAVEFEIPMWKPGFRGMSSNETIRRVSLFTTPMVSPGHHSVEATNLGNAETVPLPLNFMYVEHGDVDGTTARVSTPAHLGGQLTQASSASSKSTGTGAPAANASSSKFQLGHIIGAGAGELRKESREPSSTPEHVQLLSGLTMQPPFVSAGLYDSRQTPPSYTRTPRPEHFIAPFELSTGNSESHRPPARAIPPKPSRLLTSPSREMASEPVPVSTPWRTSPLPPYRTDPDSSQLRVVAPVVPRRLPPKLSPLK